MKPWKTEKEQMDVSVKGWRSTTLNNPCQSLKHLNSTDNNEPQYSWPYRASLQLQ